MKALITFPIAFLIGLTCNIAFAQTYYYSNSTQIAITENKSAILLFFNSINSEFVYDDNDSLITDYEYTGDSLGIVIYLSEDWQSDLPGFINYLNIDTNTIAGTSFSFLFQSGTMVFPSFNIVLKIADGYTEEDIDTILTAHGLTYLETVNGIVSATCADPGSTINIANCINNHNLIEWCHPDFLIKAIPAATYPTDALFANQYYLNNTGQTGGNIDADIDAPEAWDLTTGNNTIRVAIVEGGSGIDPHPDLLDGSGNSRVLSGYTWNGAQNMAIGSLPGSAASPSEKHGEPVAGIIAATHGYNSNACGVSGLCPVCKIVPVRAPGILFNNASNFANAIYWAFLPNFGNADLINCSWNLGINLTLPIITMSIHDAMTFGRNGKGCPVIFSAGNTGAGVSYPADIPGVICVSALDKFGNLTTYSSSGPEVTVAAFGGNPTSPIYKDIYSTFLVGAGNAYSCGGYDYINGFGGTSAAAPQVAGIVALLLSTDPNLFAYQCSCRVANSATDIGTFGLDNLYGHGRANAYYSIALTNLSFIDEEIKGEQYFAATDFIIGPAASSLLAMNGCVIKNGANVSAVAGRGIVLNPGFQAENGAVFSGTINTTTPCGTNNNGPFRINQPSNSSKTITDLQCKIKISPNPSFYNLLVSTIDTEITFKKIKVFDVLGRKNQIIDLFGEKSFLLTVSNFNKGIYFLEIETNFGTVVKKFLKQ